MSRYLVNDPTKKDPRALLNVEKLSTIMNTISPTPYYITSDTETRLKVLGGCIIPLSSGGIFKTTDTFLTVSNLDVGSAFVVGRDYYIYICDNGGDDEVYKISLNTTFPSGFNEVNSRKIGGFHVGRVRKVSNLQPLNPSNIVNGDGWEGNVVEGIIPRSVWTLYHRPKCDPEGMTYLGSGVWVDIYLSADDGKGGLISKYNTTPITGTEGLDQYTINERALVVNKRLMTYDEACRAAYGSPEGRDDDNTMAWSATTNTGRKSTGFVKNAVSAIGCVDCVGNVYEWTSTMLTRAEHNVNSGDTHGTTGAWAWDKTSPFPGCGNIYQYYNYSLAALRFGGSWSDGSHCGRRTANLGNYPWGVYRDYGCRLACDSL